MNLSLPYATSILFSFLIFSIFIPAFARGGQRSPKFSGVMDDSYVGNGRRLSEVNHSKASVDVSRGYMTNSDLEKAVKEFGRRCSNISRIYRDFWNP